MIAEKYFANPASRTLLIPLAVRVQESNRSDGLFFDSTARALAARLPNELLNFKMNPFMRVGTAIRIRYFDDLQKNFIATHDNPVIVQLGCGLDTRFSRTDTGKGIHINIDLPEVMALRAELLPEHHERCIDWTYSILDDTWINKLQADYPHSNFMFIAEGVLLYIEKSGVDAFFKRIAEQFPNSQLVFDTTSPRVAKMINKRSVVSQMGASLLWTYDDDGSIEACHPALQRLSKQYYFNIFKERCGLLRFAHYLPGLGKESVMYHYKVKA